MLHQKENVEEDEDDDDDDIPLINIVTRDKFNWKNNVTTTHTVLECSKPIDYQNIPEACKTPSDIFTCLISEKTLEHIVFYTKLYAKL